MSLLFDNHIITYIPSNKKRPEIRSVQGVTQSENRERKKSCTAIEL
ncbi:hypothetical protein CANFE04_15830 [Ligilactobacillus animalis]